MAGQGKKKREENTPEMKMRGYFTQENGYGKQVCFCGTPSFEKFLGITVECFCRCPFLSFSFENKQKNGHWSKKEASSACTIF